MYRRFTKRLLMPVALIAASILCAHEAHAAIQNWDAPAKEEFPVPSALRDQVRFWEKIFGKYPSTTIVIHDALDPGRIVDLIDFTVYGKTSNGVVPRAERMQIADNFIERYQLAVSRFQKYGRKAIKFGSIEKRLLHVYSRRSDWLKRLYQGRVTIRAQAGLADDFIGATSLAQAYLPFMEKVFEQEGVPTKVTRLAFVESMFNAKALSKVGASGVWQFMPTTARSYIRVNQLVDERNSVYKSTYAAAKLLKENYRMLGTWPLAITAYNHGPGGLRSAVKAIGSKDIGRIVAEHRSRSFGFASRNFYTEFVAAANVYDRIISAGRAKSAATLPQLKTITLQTPLSVERLLKLTPLDEEDLRNHNPCLRPAAFRSLRDRPLPKHYQIHVPIQIAQAVNVALNERQTTYARR